VAKKQLGEGKTGVQKSAGSVRGLKDFLLVRAVYPGNGPVVDPTSTPTSWSCTRSYSGLHATKKVARSSKPFILRTAARLGPKVNQARQRRQPSGRG
jgi:hypothetical protein